MNQWESWRTRLGNKLEANSGLRNYKHVFVAAAIRPESWRDK